MTSDPTPPRPVPVVRLIVPDAQGRVLILRRAPGTQAGCSWCLPGGKVGYGETVEDAVRRELRQETALECDRALFLFYQDSPPTERGAMHCINLYFECAVSGQPALNPESSAFAWIGAGDLEAYDLAFRNALGLRRYWESAGVRAARQGRA
jgi:8-oxo-dGTP diphosphatase